MKSKEAEYLDTIAELDRQLCIQRQLNEHLIEKNKTLEAINSDQWEIIKEYMKNTKVRRTTK